MTSLHYEITFKNQTYKILRNGDKHPRKKSNQITRRHQLEDDVITQFMIERI